MKKKEYEKRLEKLILIQGININCIDFRIACLILALLKYEEDKGFLDILIDDIVYGIEKFTSSGKRIIFTEGLGYSYYEVLQSIERLSNKEIIKSKKINSKIYRVF